MRDFFSSRSGIENSWSCPRKGFLNQFYLGRGITRKPRPYWLDVGSAVHLGLTYSISDLPEDGINAALQYWEESGQRDWMKEFNFVEQGALIEALLRAFNAYSLAPFLERFRVLAIEDGVVEPVSLADNVTLHRMSRPDAIVLDKQTGEVVVISWKTIDTPTDKRRRAFKRDLQGITEGHYAEQWLLGRKQELRRELVKTLNSDSDLSPDVMKAIGQKLIDMADQPAKVDYVQTIFLVKGPRVKVNKEKAEEDGEGFEWINTMSDAEEYDGAWRQDTFLLYPWVFDASVDTPSNSRAARKEELGSHNPMSWTYRYQRNGNKTKSTLGKLYTRRCIGLDCEISLREWIGLLAERKVFPNTFDASLENPLEKVILWEAARYLPERLTESIIEQTRWSEIRRMRNAEAVDSAEIEHRMHALDMYFPMHLSACDEPYRCEYNYPDGPCFGPEPLNFTDVPENYELRTPHHQVEYDALIKLETAEEA